MIPPVSLGYATGPPAFSSRLPAFVPDREKGHMEVIPLSGGVPDFVIIEPRRPIGRRGFLLPSHGRSLRLICVASRILRLKTCQRGFFVIGYFEDRV